MTQMISDFTYCTEHSGSLIDIFLVSNPLLVTISGVGEPFLDQNMHYHCRIYCCFKFSKPSHSTFKRRIWQYGQGNFDLLTEEMFLNSTGTLFGNLILNGCTTLLGSTYSKGKELLTKRNGQIYIESGLATNTKARSNPIEKLAERLRIDNLSSSIFWKFIKQFTRSSASNQNIPILNTTINFILSILTRPIFLILFSSRKQNLMTLTKFYQNI
ncbi:hypothetical protein MAR_034981, partial [Mya arenaria]